MLMRKTLESRQIAIYFTAILFGVVVSLIVPMAGLAVNIEPALTLMLFVTSLQVPLAELQEAALRPRFLGALAVANFVAIPLLVLCLVQWAPTDRTIRLGVLMVLLTPCIDYVVTFSHIGRADARSLLASTPVLLLLQMLLLPVYLRVFLGREAGEPIQIGPFVHAFVWLIVIPLTLAAIVQLRVRKGRALRLKAALDHLPVPSTALVLFLVFAAVTPQLGSALPSAMSVVPIYLAFALMAPVIGWGVAHLARLSIPDIRAVSFSSATRNSLVVLPLTMGVPEAMPLLPVVVVSQTVVELMASLAYMKIMPTLGKARETADASDQ